MSKLDAPREIRTRSMKTAKTEYWTRTFNQLSFVYVVEDFWISGKLHGQNQKTTNSAVIFGCPNRTCSEPLPSPVG